MSECPNQLNPDAQRLVQQAKDEAIARRKDKEMKQKQRKRIQQANDAMAKALQDDSLQSPAKKSRGAPASSSDQAKAKGVKAGLGRLSLNEDTSEDEDNGRTVYLTATQATAEAAKPSCIMLVISFIATMLTGSPIPLALDILAESKIARAINAFSVFAAFYAFSLTALHALAPGTDDPDNMVTQIT